MDNDGDSPPTFWFQPPIATRRRPPSPFLNPVALIIILPILVLFLIFFFLPPFLNHTSHVLKPASVKKSWDPLNIFLVLFAIICGILSRKNDDIPPSADDDGGSGGDQVNRAVTSSQWGEYDDRDRRVFISSIREPVDKSRLRRNSSSYPDLRQESLWDTGDNRFRFFDDFGVNLHSFSTAASGFLQEPARRSKVETENVVYLSPPTLPLREVEGANVLQRTQPAESVYVHEAPIRSETERGKSQTTVSEYFDYRPRRNEGEREFSVEKDIPVDTFQVHRYPLPPSPPQSPAPPPPPPLPAVHSKRRHSYQSVKRKEKVKIESEGEFEKLRPPSTPPPPPPPPPPQKHKKLERQISDATKEIATAITSLYNQSKRKKKHRTRNIYDNATLSPLSSNSSPEQAAAPPPTPPPLPPPPFVFHNMFKKGSKQKRIHSIAVTSPPPQLQPPSSPPPPPPPPNSIFNNLFKSGGKSKRSNTSTAPLRRPPPPPPSVIHNNFKSGSINKRHSSAVYPPPAPLPPLSPTIFTKCRSTESVQAYSNSPVVSPRLSRRKSQTPPRATPTITESLRRRPSNKGKPPLPTRSSKYYEREDYHEYLNSGSQSPLNPIPPPLPPFQMPEMKFKVRGDFVSIRSAQSSVSNSPDRNDPDFSSLVESDGGEVIGPVFFPSPDVNAQADSFISRLKDEWRMEKVKAKGATDF